MFQSLRNTLVARQGALNVLRRTVSGVPARNLSFPAKTGSFATRQKAIRPINSYSFRHYSVLTQSAAKEYKYQDVKKLVQEPGTALLIDVREPAEFHEGHIPGAKNVPFKSSPGAFDLTEEEFEESFGFPKPAKDQPLVFYCLGGVRLTAAEELANSFGYTKRGNYVGSYEDWVTQEHAAKKA